MVYWFSSFRHHFDLVKQVKCAVFRNFHDNVREEWAEICHVHLYLVISQKWKGQILAHENDPVTERGIFLTTVQSDFSSFLLLSPYKTIPFHNITKGGCLSGRIVIILLIMYSQIVYDNKQPNAMLWSSSQMCSWLHPYSAGFILRQCAPTVGFIPKYSWHHHPRFSRANISAALAN